MKKVFVIFLFLLICSFSFSSLLIDTSAQTKNYRGQVIQPIFTQKTLKRGEVYTGTIEFINDLSINYTLDIDIFATDFKAAKDGVTKDESIKLPPSASLASWIKLPKNHIVVKQDQIVEVPFVIEVPLDAEPCSKFASINFIRLIKPNDPAGNVGLQGKLQHTLLVTVEGECPEQLSLVEFKSDKGLYSDSWPFFEKYSFEDSLFTTIIRNTGSVHLSPSGTIKVSGGWIGEEATIAFNPISKDSLGYVLPDKEITRTYQNILNDGKFRFGPFTTTLTLNYGVNTSGSITKTITIWIIPWKAITIGVGILAILILIIIGWKKIKNRNIVNYKKLSKTVKN